MRTLLLPSAKKGSGNVCLKVAEGPKDYKRLVKIRTNLAILRRLLPEMAPEILEEGADRLLTTAWEGTTFNSEQAREVYESLPWVIEAILTQLDKLQSCQADRTSLVFHKLRLLRHLAGTWKSGILLPLHVQRQFLYLVTKDLQWVLSHGDLTEWNIVINSSKRCVAFIDWEALAFRPRFYDEFFLAFHRCVAIEDMTWQRSFLRKRFLSGNQPLCGASSVQAVVVVCLANLYRNEVQRARTDPYNKEGERRIRIRHDNLLYFAEKSNWSSWLGWLLG